MQAVAEVEMKTEESSDSGTEKPVMAPKYEKCQACEKECSKKIKRCKSCKGGLYCSRKCREDHVEHEEICKYIVELEKIEHAKNVITALSVREKNQVKVKVKDSLVNLVGEKPMLSCTLNGKQSKALWDTGAMVSMVDRAWITETDPECEILSVEEFLKGDNLHLYAANNTKVDIEGVAMVKFGLGSVEIPVPFLVTKDKLDTPIIGYNLIKHLVPKGFTLFPIQFAG